MAIATIFCCAFVLYTAILLGLGSVHSHPINSFHALPPWHYLEDNDIEMDKTSMNTTTIYASAVGWTNSLHQYSQREIHFDTLMPPLIALKGQRYKNKNPPLHLPLSQNQLIEKSDAFLPGLC